MTVRLFYSYTRADAKLRAELDNYLILLSRLGLIKQWHDRNISAGEDWRDRVDECLNQAHIILLLISPDFLASDYCNSVEMGRALERHKAGEAHVILILLRLVHWKDGPLANLRVLPGNGDPVALWDNRDEAFRQVVKGIIEVVERLQPFLRPQSTVPAEAVPPNNAEIRCCQKRVSELAEVHHLLHEVERELNGMSIVIRGLMGGESEWIDLHGFNIIQPMWQWQVLPGIKSLVDFTSMETEALRDEYRNIDREGVRGPGWVTDLFDLLLSLDVKINKRDINGLEDEHTNLLRTCRIHLDDTDKRLRRAIEELNRSL